MTTHIPVSEVAPKAVHLQYILTVLEPNNTEYSTCLLCKNLTEAKRLYKEYVKKCNEQDLVSVICLINRQYSKETLSSNVVLCKSVGKVKA
jgi:hypothetical protein